MILWIFCLVEIVFSKDDFWGISFFFFLVLMQIVFSKDDWKVWQTPLFYLVKTAVDLELLFLLQ